MVDAEFVFSQLSLSDFADCPRRFYLRYVLRQPWPQIEPTPEGMEVLAYRDFLRKGAALHRWIERRWLGLPEADGAMAAGLVADPEFALWWRRFEEEDFTALPAVRTPELELLAPLGRFRLTARLDLLAVDEDTGRAVVVDWKTLRGERAQRPEFLRERMQTRVYLYALAAAGAPYRGGANKPDDCEFHYWMANAPEPRWVRFRYDQDAFDQDRAFLTMLSEDIAARDDEAEFEMTTDERKCAMCGYHTLCRRSAAVAADLRDIDEDVDIERAIAGVEELEY
ncbi:MAG: PD-(D/E)XK nuclease family protein [Chloroflexi bacterium]|nr:PD-(D/E)XK nuclease family protein [Chloroflexota bacterium]